MKLGASARISKGDSHQSIAIASALGYPGLHLDSSILRQYPDPHELKALLASHELALVALSSGSIGLDPGLDAEIIEAHVKNARYLRAAGGKYLLITGVATKRQDFTANEYRQAGKLLTEIGKRTADYGVQTGFQNRMDTIGQTPKQVDSILAAVDSRYVKYSLDVQHYLQGGGDPGTAIRVYDKRMVCVHLQDLQPAVAKDQYQAPTLLPAKNDIRQIGQALHSSNFNGWSFIGLDGQKLNAINAEYLTKKLGVQA
ncbi:TIM barrel protein [Edaphobacter paludis]|uniref:TIM barrel protein n=1 Tax=Edaphobacter paludis TaxID=3035702 RepID=A0AAU7CTJ6_9BACT